MRNFIYGTVFGIVVASVGFTDIDRIMDKAVNATKTQAVEMSK